MAENEPEAAPLEDQAQQVQRVRTAGGVLPVLLHLGLQHPHSGAWAEAVGLLTCTTLTHSRAVSPPPHRRTLQQIPRSFGRITLTLGWCKSVLLYLFLCVWKKSCNSRSSTTCPLSRFQVKFFYICQIAYWLHALPELYFQKVRKVRGGVIWVSRGQTRVRPGSIKAKDITFFILF